ncbi:MAG: 3-phosphoglycerate dehydrogenase [Candidatus Rokubacteria bacterium]|nr:3-phosphoglycerate dehydrogenase [Candidatus Rokubacteria bacterium]
MKVLVTGPSGPLDELDVLREAGLEVIAGRPLDHPNRKPYTDAELAEAARDVDVILASELERIGRELVTAARRLRLVVVPFIGVDKIDVKAATELGVLVANSVTVESLIGVAEAAIGFAIMLLKRIKHNEARLRRGEWARREDRGDLLQGKTIGIVGLGRAGAEVAKRLVNWGVRLIALDPYVSEARARELGVTLVSLPELLTEADVITLHATLTEETRDLIGEKELRLMKRSAILINTARGELVDEEALAHAVHDRWIAGAAVDAFSDEPLSMSSGLRAADGTRLILTPHNASHTEAGRRASLRLAFEQIVAACRGEVPAGVVNPEALARWRGRPA